MASITVTVYQIDNQIVNVCERNIDCTRAKLIRQTTYNPPHAPVPCDEDYIAPEIPVEIISYDGHIWMIAKTADGIIRDCIDLSTDTNLITEVGEDITTENNEILIEE